jgi:predicted small secreted protein
MKTRATILLAIVALSLAVAGCNTTAGLGRDMNSAGHAITDTAEDAKQK